MVKRSRSEEKSGQRNNVVVPLGPAADAIVDAWCEETGASKAAVIRRLIEWFSVAPKALKQMITGPVPDDMRAAYAQRAIEFVQVFAAGGKWLEGQQAALPIDPRELVTQINNAAGQLTRDEIRQIAKILHRARGEHVKEKPRLRIGKSIRSGR